MKGVAMTAITAMTANSARNSVRNSVRNGVRSGVRNGEGESGAESRAEWRGQPSEQPVTSENEALREAVFAFLGVMLVGLASAAFSPL